MVYCSKCGAEVPDGAVFCPKCGADMGAPGVFDRHAQRQINRQARREWRWGWRSSPEYGLISAVSAGLIVIVLGMLLYMVAAHVSPFVQWYNFWAYFLVAIGAILAIRAVIGMAMFPNTYYRFGGIIGGVIMMAIGSVWLSITLFGWYLPLWPLVIVGGGVLVIAVGVVTYLARKA